MTDDGFCDQCRPGGKPGQILNDHTGDWLICPHVAEEANSSQIVQINKLSVEVSKLKKKLAGKSLIVTNDDERERASYEVLRRAYEYAILTLDFEWHTRFSQPLTVKVHEMDENDWIGRMIVKIRTEIMGEKPR